MVEVDVEVEVVLVLVVVDVVEGISQHSSFDLQSVTQPAVSAQNKVPGGLQFITFPSP